MTTMTFPDLIEAHEFGVILARFLDTRIRVGLCTCCADPRPMLRIGDDQAGEWMHADDETFAEHRHVHEMSSSRDCDGLYDGSRVLRIPSIRHEALKPLHLRHDPESGPDFHDLWVYLARHAAPLWRDCKVEVEGDGDRLTWSAPTDEGFESGSLWICADVWCAHDKSTFRDHSAEAAGY